MDKKFTGNYKNKKHFMDIKIINRRPRVGFQIKSKKIHDLFSLIHNRKS